MFDLDIRLRRGDFARHVRVDDGSRVIALTGRSGAGKTSVLHAIAGLVRPESGRIAIGERVLFDAANGIDLPPHLRRVGYVFQDTRLFPHRDVAGNLRYGRHPARGRPRFDFDAVAELLGVAPLLSRRTANLSGGEAQRVAIGRALLSQPDILLLDEPLSMLDAARREELLPYLRRVRDEARLPIVYVSHHAADAAQLSASIHALD